MPVVGPAFQGMNPGPPVPYGPGAAGPHHPGHHGPPPPHMVQQQQQQPTMMGPPMGYHHPHQGPGPIPNGGAPLNGGGGPGMVPMPQASFQPQPQPPQQPMTMHDQAEAARLAQDYEALVSIIKQWNANRLDLFALTLPNEQLEFHGVMRFYYQSSDSQTGQKVATKCIRVSSTATTKLIIENLIEKFRPDMKMLEVPEYALYEIHESGERRLGFDEKPLLVQLNWHKDDREGRFLLRRIDDVSMLVPSQPSSTSAALNSGNSGGSGNPNDNDNGSQNSGGTGNGPEFKRKLSKREKKELKKQEKLQKQKAKENKGDESVADQLYTEFPDTSFTRSISNPEAVMRRRRQQKLEKKLQQFRSKDGGPDTGGTLKIYGEALCRDVPYKTLLLSVSDCAGYVVEEMLEKYGIDRSEATGFCLVQCTTQTNSGPGGDPSAREYYLEDEECPLAILMNHPPSRGTVTFHVRKKPQDLQLRRRKKKQQLKEFISEPGLGVGPQGGPPAEPFLMEMNPDGTDVVGGPGPPQRFRLSPNVTEVGSDPAIQSGQSLLLPPAQFLHPRHCVLAYTDGIVTVTPNHREAETYVNNQRVFETTILSHGCVLRFGRPGHCFRFVDPNVAADANMSSATLPDPARMAETHGNYVHFGPPPPGQGRVGGPPGAVVAPTPTPSQMQQQRNNILPAVLEFREETEEAFFNSITLSLTDVNSVQFKLAPTYTIYMATRFRASIHYRPELIPEERAVRLTDMLNRVAERVFATIEEHVRDAAVLAFWMANASELLHFLKSDRHITSFSHQAQDMLAEAVHLAFKQLVVCLQSDLEMTMPALMSDVDDSADSGVQQLQAGGQQPPGNDQATAGTMQILSSAMALLRKCRVNAALTIQLFSQLFHFVNMWTFNQIVTNHFRRQGESPVNYCTHRWGFRLKKRLSKVETWAEKQGLELAADCHLARVVQAAHLLQARKNTAEDIASVSSICFKLNSLQLKTLLDRYEPAPDERPISREMIDTIVRVAENTVDEVTNSEGREVRLEEDFVLQLPFLLPEDGYSCGIVRGVPGGLADFLAPLQRVGLCVMTPQPSSSGFWTIYMDVAGSGSAGGPGTVTPTPSEMSSTMGPASAASNSNQAPPEPEVQMIKLVKSTSGMGLSIVAAKGIGKDRLGIYIKAVVEGGAAFYDGRLAAGDQLLRVDGQSLVGITQERAAEIMMHTGQVVELEVAKQGAIFHGLATLLSQPSPVMSPRSAAGQVGGPGPNKVTQSKSMSAMPTSHTAFSQQQHEQHTYQNHRPDYPPPQGHGGSMGPQGPHPPPPSAINANRSTSVGNLTIPRSSGQQQPGMNPPPPQVNGVVGHHHGGPQGPGGRFPSQPDIPAGFDQGYYQNVGGGHNGHTAPQLQQHMPLRYHQQVPPQQQQQQLRGSQSSLPRGAGGLGGSGNYAMYPPQTQQQFDSPDNSHLHHASPRIAGTPGAPGGPMPPSKLVPVPAGSASGAGGMTPTGPEEPQRSYPSDQEPQAVTSKKSSNSRVRFQDPEAVDHEGSSRGGLSTKMDQLNLNSNKVEEEFRKRVAEYKSSSHVNGGLAGTGGVDSSSDTEDRRRMPPPPRQPHPGVNGGSSAADTPTPPPPLPDAPPPMETPPTPAAAASRLDMLVGGGGSSSMKSQPTSSNGGSANGTPTKRVSFMNSDPSDPVANERVSRLENVEKDPNKFISEAESLLNSSSLALGDGPKGEPNVKLNVGHTPSVIGAQEVYRDPRQRRMEAAEQEKKTSTTTRPDGAKLSFQEKMKLFRAEAGENTPNNTAKKTSKVQRDLESPSQESSQ